MDLLKTDIEGVKASQVKMKTELKNMISSSYIIKLNLRIDKLIDENIDSDQMLDSRVTEMKKSLRNLENISFCDYSGGSKDIKLVWKLENYQHLADIGKDVFSPIFGTRLDGHCFQLWVDWNASGDFGLYLKLHRPESSDKEKILDSFAVPFNLEVMGNAGTPSVIKTVPLEVINAHREKFFTIKAYDDRADSVLGWSKLVLKKDIHRYIVNDSLTLVCRLKPS